MKFHLLYLNIMIGILIISHGGLSEGMKDTLSMFFNNEKQFEIMKVCCDTNLDCFKNEMGEKINEIDTGDGVIILADIFGGSPCNTTYNFLKRNIHIITGVNFPMVLSAVTNRMTITDLNELAVKIINEGRNAIIDVNEKFEGIL